MSTDGSPVVGLSLGGAVAAGVANSVALVAATTDATILAWGTFAVTVCGALASLGQKWWEGRQKSLARDLKFADLRIESLEGQIAEMKKEHAEEIAGMKASHEKELGFLRDQITTLLARFPDPDDDAEPAK